MASTAVPINRTPSASGGTSLLDRILSRGKDIVKGAGDVVQGVLGNPTVQKVSDAVLDVYVAKSAAKIERDQSRERPEAAQAAGGDPASSSATVTGAPPMEGVLGGLGTPIAIAGALVLGLVVVLALRR